MMVAENRILLINSNQVAPPAQPALVTSIQRLLGLPGDLPEEQRREIVGELSAELRKYLLPALGGLALLLLFKVLRK